MILNDSNKAAVDLLITDYVDFICNAFISELHNGEAGR